MVNQTTQAIWQAVSEALQIAIYRHEILGKGV